MKINAEHTNALTNIVHSGFLLIYFIASLYLYFIGDPRFANFMLVSFFACLFILKMLGAYAHYASIRTFAWPWKSIGYGLLLLNLTIVLSHQFPILIKVLIIVSTTLFSVWYFLTSYKENQANFNAIAITMIFTYFILCFYTKGLVQLGFELSVLANIAWLGMRKTLIKIGKNSYEYRYDNDIYHILLTIATFITFKGILDNDWLLQIL